MNYKEILGALATIIAFVGYVPYFRDMFAGRTKPHAFTWLVWGSLTAIGFFGQLADGGGPGIWVTGFTAAVCFTIFAFALVKGKRNIAPIDWIFLASAGVALFFWYLTNSPLISVILISVIDAVAFLPTVRKSFHKPYEETASTYLLSSVKFVISIVALNKISVITSLYPISLIFMNTVFLIMLAIRRKKIAKPKT